MFGELVIPRGDEEQAVLKVFDSGEFQYFVVVVDDLLADFFGRHVNHNKILILESKYPRQLAILSLSQVLNRQSLLLISLNRVYVNLDPLLLLDLLVIFLELQLSLLERTQHLCVPVGDQLLQLQTQLLAPEVPLQNYCLLP